MFITLLEETKNIFDIMAVCYKLIIGEYNSENISSILSKQDTYKPVQDLVISYIENYESGIATAFQDLKEGLIFFNSSRKFEFGTYYTIIDTIDKNIEYKNKKMTFFYEMFNKYEALNNTNFRDINIRILPVLPKTYMTEFEVELKKHEYIKQGSTKGGLRGKRTYDPTSINSELDNYVIIQDQALGEYIPRIYELCDENQFGQYILTKGEINIGIFPLVNINKRQIFKMDSNDKYFWINSLTEDAERIIERKCIEAIEHSYEMDVDIVILPEMLVSTSIVNKVKDTLSRYSHINKQKIFVLGSMWNDRENKSIVLSQDGNVIFEQYKKTPFVMEGKREYLSLSNKYINIIDIPLVGRIFVFICKDMDNDNLMNIPKILRGDLILLPAFSPSLDIKTLSEALASLYHCSTIMVNSCAALCKDGEDNIGEEMITNNKKIGYICTPAKKYTSSSSYNTYYRFGQRCMDCEQSCKGIITSINFKTIKDDGIVKTYSTYLND